MQLDFFDVPSPCIGICQSDNKGYCLGCFRTRDERLQWTHLSIDDKKKVIKRCIQRKRRKDAKDKLIIASEAQQANKHTEPEIQQPSLLEPPSNNTIDNSAINIDDFSDFDL